MSQRFKFVSVLVLLGMLLSACGAAATTEPAAPAPGESAATAGAPASGGEPVTISLWTPENREADVAAHKWLIEEFEKQYPNINVDYVITTWDDHVARIMAAKQAGTLPDIINQWGSAASMYEQGITQPVDDVWAELGEDNFSPATEQSCLSGETHVCVPYIAYPHVVFYKKDLFQAAGLGAPKTYDEFIAAAKALTRDGQYGVAYYDRAQDAYYIMDFMLTNNAHPLSPDLTSCTFDTPEMIGVLEMNKEIIDNQYTPDGWLAWNMDDARLTFAGGQGAMLLSSTSFLNVLANDYPDLLPNIGAFPVPMGVGPNTGLVPSSKYAVTSGAQHPEEAKLFLEFMFKPEIYREFIERGVKGFLPVYLPVANDPAFLASDTIAPYAEIYDAAKVTMTKGMDYVGSEFGASTVGSAIYEEMIYSQMGAKLAEGVSPEEVAAWAQGECERIMAND